ncbi:anthocyanidin 3-O-glucosyltransferase 5-like [Gastrolobium bilobum]|uniref:anthocyanidin 3-O-glucosyltransferase 5-like n=1 Tax=Gastrolobium bilobum TaxID=150636 RepID=UPI002AB24D15|nr:anthocyanidin 3-O-glucosyltransferase 5-like [Gastrolobium bilobum]
MQSVQMDKPHVALISSPGFGHLISVIELANRLVTQHNLKATVLAITCQTSEPQTQVLNSTMNPNLCDIIEIPGAKISYLFDPDTTVPTLRHLNTMMHETKPAILCALSNMKPCPSTIIYDLFSVSACLSIAQELNMQKFVYVASHAWFLSLVAYSLVLDKEAEGQFTDQKEPIKIPGCKPVRPEDVIDSIVDRNSEQYQTYLSMVSGIVEGDAFLVNTWENLQHKELQALRDQILKVPVYGIGPVVREAESAPSELTEWLDMQPSESVIYVSFGSVGALSYEEVTEVAWGLEMSGYRFVWVVRLPSLTTSIETFFGKGKDDDDGDPLSYLPEGFLLRNQKMGLLVTEWAPQVAILKHSSVGGFMSHCGWSSTLESITNGVPMIAWPLYAEQWMNATLLEEELGVAVRLERKKVVEREEIARKVREIMEVDREGKPNPIRERVKELKRSAMKAVSVNGSSYTALSEVAKRCKGRM